MHKNEDEELDSVTAAGNPFAGKNSRLERSLRARAQLRDGDTGRFLYMGGGLGSLFRLPSGRVVNTIGRFVGASKKEGFAQLMVEDSQEGVEAGVYDVPAAKSKAAKAIIPGTPSTVVYDGPLSTEKIIDLASLERRDAPDGWDLTEDGIFKSQDGEWEISKNENGRYTISQNGEKLEGDYRDAATAITRATAVDAENTADEETKKRVATLRSEGASQKKIDRALFNEPEDEAEDEDEAELESPKLNPNLEKLLEFEYDMAAEDRAMRDRLINNPVIWKEFQNDRFNELVNERNKFYNGLSTEEKIALRESQLEKLQAWADYLEANGFYDPTVSRDIREVEGMVADLRGDNRAQVFFPGLIDFEDSDEERSLQLAVRNPSTSAGTKAVTTFNPSAPGMSPRREVWTKQEDGTWKNDETGLVREELPKPWTIQDGFGRGGYSPVQYFQFPADDGKDEEKDKPKAELPARSSDEIRTDLNELNDRFETLEAELRALAESEEDSEVASDKLDELLAVTEEIDKLERELNRARLIETPREATRQAGPDTVESIRRRIERLEAQAERRAERGEDTGDIDKEIEQLEQQAKALEDAGETDGTGEGKPEPAAGGEGEERPSDGGRAGTLPGDMGEEDAPSSDLERRGDSLRDVHGNVIARKVDDVANAEEIRESGAKVVDLFEVDPIHAETFRNALIEAAKSNPYGGSVTIHDLEYYQQPGVRMFLTQDGKGGIVLNGDEVVSGFMGDDAVDKGRGAVQSMISKMVELGGRRLDAYDTILPELYAEAGFKPVARIKWNDEFAPEGWDYELYGQWNDGRPDIVFMAYDPERVGSKYDKSEGEYVEDYDMGEPAQRAALEPITDEQVLNDLTERQRAALARREAAQAANDVLAGEDGLLVGSVPLDARETISHQALQLAPIGQVVEATSRNGRKRRFIKVGKDTWKRTDKPDDKKRYRSYELRGGSAEFVERTDADVPSADEVRGPVDRYRPKPFAFPRNATEAELERLREIYQNQADTDDNEGLVLRAEETVRLIDRVLARLRGEPMPRRRSAAQRRVEDQQAGAPTEPANIQRRRPAAPLVENNIPEAGVNQESYTPTNEVGDGATDDPEVLAQMFDSADLKRAYQEALLSANDFVSLQFPGLEGEEGPRANVSIDAIRDALQLQGIDTNALADDVMRQLDETPASEISQRGPEDDVTRSQFLDGLYQTRHELEAAISLAVAQKRPQEEILNLIDTRNGITRAIRRLENMGFRSTTEAETVDLDSFQWDDNSPDIYNPDLILEAMKRKFPEGTVLPNGDLLVGSNEVTDRNGNRFRYDVIVTKTEDEMFYTYIRETNLAMEGQPGSVRSMRVGKMRQSAHALNNQVTKALSKIYETDRRVKINSWFNDARNRRKEGMVPVIDELDENGVPTHLKQRVFTYEAIRKIQEAVNDDDITEEMINTLYNYVLNMGNGEDVAATIYESFGLDINTMNKLLDAVNENINNRLDEVTIFSKWQSSNGTPIAEGDIVKYVGGPDQPGYEQLNGRSGIVKIRRLEHTVTDSTTGAKYTYTDMVYLQMIDENGNPTGENYRIVPAKHLEITKTAAGTDGSERRGPYGMPVPAPALTRRAVNRYAGRRRLRDVAPYVSQYDRDNLDSPSVTIDGTTYPVRLSRASLIPENVEKIAARPGDLQVGDFISTYETIDGYPTARLNEIVGIEELEDGSRLVHTVMPLDLFSGRVSSTQYGADDAIALEVYREADVPEVEVDMNAPGLTSDQVARLAELAHQVDITKVDPETMGRVQEIVSSTTPENLPYTPRQYADIFRELLEAQETGLRGPVSPEEAARLLEEAARRGQGTPEAEEGLISTARAGRQRSSQINGNIQPTSSRTVSPAGQAAAQTDFVDRILERGPYSPEAGQSPISAEEMREAIESGDTDKIRSAVEKVYGNRVFGSKFIIEGFTVRVNDDDGITWGGRLVDPETGRKVGDVSRDINIDFRGRLNVYHRYLWIDATSNRGTGFSTEFKKLSDDFYKSIGVDYITISTVSDGSYAWGKANYTWKNKSDAEALKIRLQLYRNNLPAGDVEDREILTNLIDRFTNNEFMGEDFPDPIDIANLTKADGTPWGREIMTDSGWAGIRYLDPELDPRPQNRKDKGKASEPVPGETKESKPTAPSEQTEEEEEEIPVEDESEVPELTSPDGTILSPEWIVAAEDGSILSYTTLSGENKVARKIDGKWYDLSFDMDNNPSAEVTPVPNRYLENFIVRGGEDGTSIRDVSANPEEFKQAEQFASGIIENVDLDEMAVIEALQNGDAISVGNIFVQELFGNGNRRFGDFFVRNAKVTADNYRDTGQPRITITASIVNDDGEEVGSIVRVLKQNRDGDLRVVHSLMKIYEDENKGTGFSSQFSAASEELYKRMNVAEIETATAWDGSYVWARAKYDWNTEEYSRTMALGGVPDALDEALDDAIQSGRVKDANAIGEIIERLDTLEVDDPDFPTPFEISSLESEDPTIRSWGRMILEDTKWFGIKRLRSEDSGEDQGESAAAETESPVEVDEAAVPRVSEFVLGEADEFEGWNFADGLAFRQARLQAARVSAMRLIEDREWASEEEREAAVRYIDLFLPETAEDDDARYFAIGNVYVRIPNVEMDSPNTYAIMNSLRDIVKNFPPGLQDKDFAVNIYDEVNSDMPEAAGRFMPALGMIDYFTPTIVENWLSNNAAGRGWLSPAVDELLDENEPEDTLNAFIAHIVGHEYGHLVDSSYSNEGRDLRTLFREELDRAGLTDIVGRYANSYEDADARVGGNIRNAEYFAEAFAQMISEDIAGATRTPLGDLMRKFLEDNGVTV